MKVTSDRCLSVLGFSPQSCVCLHQTMGSSVQVVVPMPHDEVKYDQPFLYWPLSLSSSLLPSLSLPSAGRAMSGLIHASTRLGQWCGQVCVETECSLVSLPYFLRQGIPCVLACNRLATVLCVCDVSQCLLMLHLPYMEDAAVFLLSPGTSPEQQSHQVHTPPYLHYHPTPSLFSGAAVSSGLSHYFYGPHDS